MGDERRKENRTGERVEFIVEEAGNWGHQTSDGLHEMGRLLPDNWSRSRPIYHLRTAAREQTMMPAFGKIYFHRLHRLHFVTSLAIVVSREDGKYIPTFARYSFSSSTTTPSLQPPQIAEPFRSPAVLFQSHFVPYKKHLPGLACKSVASFPARCVRYAEIEHTKRSDCLPHLWRAQLQAEKVARVRDLYKTKPNGLLLATGGRD